MRSCRISACLIAVFACLAGCVERTEKVTLNPDGSGKSQMNLVLNFPPVLGILGGKARVPLPPPLAARQAAIDVMKSAKGVEAWSDVSYEFLGGQRMRFKGTAYFKDINKFEIPKAAVTATSWTKDADGNMVLKITPGKDLDFPTLTPPQTQPSDEQVKAGMEIARAAWQEQQGNWAVMYAQFHLDQTFLLPGKVAKSATFSDVPGGVDLVADGKKISDGLGKMINDDAALAAAIRQGWEMGNGVTQEMMNEFLFGRKGKIDISATVAGDGRPLFDYAVEAGQAGKAQEAMLKKADLIEDADIKPAPPLDQPLTPQPVN